LGRGGVRESVLTDTPYPTGLFFDVSQPIVIADAIKEFHQARARVSARANSRKCAAVFTCALCAEFRSFVSSQQVEFQQQRLTGGAGRQSNDRPSSKSSAHEPRLALIACVVLFSAFSPLCCFPPDHAGRSECHT